MSGTITAAISGNFKVGGTTSVHRLGFGSMRLTGPGIWGPPVDRAEALRTLRRLPALDVNFVDTADSYGPNVAEDLIREALHPYDGMLIATKGGLARTGPDLWTPLGRPEYLIQQAHTSRRRLGVEQIGLWQLHRIDPKVPANEQFDAHLPTGAWDTVGGLVFDLLGHVPVTGESVTSGGLRLVVDRVNGRRIERVSIEPVADASRDAAPAEAR